LEGHHQSEPVLQELVDLMGELMRDPATLLDHSARLSLCVQRLDAIWATYLKLEEEVVFAAIESQLSDEDQQRVLAEMRQRRGSQGP
jgi:hypothetical protein